MIEEQHLKLVQTTETPDEPKKPETLYPNEYVLAPQKSLFESLLAALGGATGHSDTEPECIPARG